MNRRAGKWKENAIRKVAVETKHTTKNGKSLGDNDTWKWRRKTLTCNWSSRAPVKCCCCFTRVPHLFSLSIWIFCLPNETLTRQTRSGPVEYCGICPFSMHFRQFWQLTDHCITDSFGHNRSKSSSDKTVEDRERERRNGQMRQAYWKNLLSVRNE